ncbi:hypothetical protein [Paeniglutamicibacter sp. NPDC091659]|uniref:hypothetical protein n=1 Tax=Paeniglutamicibacter sp. NPDC091659 TaxID=3364389 RepID=UPI0038138C26
MPYPMRSTVGAAVLAGALVFSGTVANAQPVPADESVASAPIEQGTPDAGESAPVLDQVDAPLPPAAPVQETSGTGGSADSATETPEAGSPDGDPAESPADIEEQPPAGSGEESGATPPATEETTPGAEAPAETPAEAPEEAPAAELPFTGETAPLTGTEAPAEQVSRPAIAVVPAPVAKTAAKEKAAAEPAAKLPGSGTIKLPEGLPDWTFEQGMEWLGGEKFVQWFDDNVDAIVELVDSEDFAGFSDDIFPYFVEGDPEGLLAYLEATYPDDLPMAQFMVGLVMGQLIEEGLLDEDGSFIGELGPETEEPSEKPDKEPSKETDEEPVIEPVVNVTKPKASTTKPVEVFTPVKVPAQGLAETGAEGIGLLAGAGGGLLVLGIGALALRRRKQA